MDPEAFRAQKNPPSARELFFKEAFFLGVDKGGLFQGKQLMLWSVLSCLGEHRYISWTR